MTADLELWLRKVFRRCHHRIVTEDGVDELGSYIIFRCGLCSKSWRFSLHEVRRFKTPQEFEVHARKVINES